MTTIRRKSRPPLELDVLEDRRLLNGSSLLSGLAPLVPLASTTTPTVPVVSAALAVPVVVAVPGVVSVQANLSLADTPALAVQTQASRGTQPLLDLDTQAVLAPQAPVVAVALNVPLLPQTSLATSVAIGESGPTVSTSVTLPVLGPVGDQPPVVNVPPAVNDLPVVGELLPPQLPPPTLPGGDLPTLPVVGDFLPAQPPLSDLPNGGLLDSPVSTEPPGQPALPTGNDVGTPLPSSAQLPDAALPTAPTTDTSTPPLLVAQSPAPAIQDNGTSVAASLALPVTGVVSPATAASILGGSAAIGASLLDLQAAALALLAGSAAGAGATGEQGTPAAVEGAGATPANAAPAALNSANPPVLLQGEPLAPDAAMPAPEGVGLVTDLAPTAAVDAVFTEAGQLPQDEPGSWQPYLTLLALGLAAALPALRWRHKKRRAVPTPEGVPI